MASLSEVEAIARANRDALIELQGVVAAIQSNTVPLPKINVHIDDETIADKTGYAVYGERAGINGGALFVGVSLVADPESDVDIQEPFIFKAI